MIDAQSYAAYSETGPLKAWDFQRRDVGDTDIQIDIQFCGVCHSDLHTAKGEWGKIAYPQVVGHEIVGKVIKAGSNVKKFKVGDMAGIGCMVDSCRSCDACQEGLQQYCAQGLKHGTYGGVEKETGKPTQGGYSSTIVVNEGYALHIPDSLDPAAAAPLLCAGITTYSPLKHWGAGPGKMVGVVGLGGLGHMAVKIAHAMGAKVILFTTSPGKVADGKKLGADDVVISKDAEAMKRYTAQLDLIIDTVSAPHDLDAYTTQLKRDGTLVLVGAPATPHPSPGVFNLLMKRRAIAGSTIGGIPETQEMLDFCVKHKIPADIELIPIQDINTAWERMLKGDVKYRFVIDMASLKAERKAA